MISSHFIYRFDDMALVAFLKKLKSTSTRSIIFSDLRRSKLSMFLFKWLRHLLPISNMAKTDRLTAIQRSFSIEEMCKIIELSGISNYQVIKKPWFRMLVKINL